MGNWFTNKKTGYAFNDEPIQFVGYGNKGILTSTTKGDHQKRHSFTRALKNQLARKNHEEAIRERRLKDALKEEKDRKAREYIQQNIEAIEMQRRQRRKLQNNPDLIEKIMARQGHVQGVLPKGLSEEKKKKQQQFINEEIEKARGERKDLEAKIQKYRDDIEANDSKIQEIDQNIDKLRQFHSNVPDQNADNDRMINNQVKKVAALKQNNEELERQLNDKQDGLLEKLKKNNEREQQLKFSIEQVDHGVTADITQTDIDPKTGGVLPKGTLAHRERSRKSYNLNTKVHSKYNSPAMGGKEQSTRTFPHPITGEATTTKLPENAEFMGFNNDGQPIFVNKGDNSKKSTNVEDIGEAKSIDRGTQLALIPGMVRREV